MENELLITHLRADAPRLVGTKWRSRFNGAAGSFTLDTLAHSRHFSSLASDDPILINLIHELFDDLFR